MSTNVSQKESPEILRLICAYCEKFKNDTGFWEQEYDHCGTFPEARKSHGVCPECFQEHYPDEYISLREEGKIVIREKILPNNTVLYGCFIHG